MPGEVPAVFSDAMRRLAASATYLYQDGPRTWYSTQPTETKLAADRAEELKRDKDKVSAELEARLRADLKKSGDFSRIHTLPSSGADVPDDLDARLVVLSSDHCHSREADSAAERAAKAILESRGSTPRLYRNTLVFLAADKVRLQDLEDALRKCLAWSSIVADTQILISHLVGQVGAEVTVTIEIEAKLPNGATDQLVRTVTENSRTLKFDSHGFEKE
jgi:hypothetical protein